jgi:hypothetical protein
MATLPNPGSRSSGGQSLNLFMAGLAALALAFFTFAMPDGLFSSLVARSGLPNLIAAAEPPLGLKARGAVIAAVAILIFASVLLLFRAIDRISARAATAKAEPAEAEAPRLRRADAHPDAPARRPLLAGRDLGDYVEPEEDEELFEYPPIEETFADLEVRPLPGFLAEEVEAPPAAIEQVPAAFAQPRENPEIDFLVAQLPDIGEVGDHESISELMRRLESGLSQRELEAGSSREHAEPALDEPQGVPQWLDASEPLELDVAAPALDAAEVEAEAKADGPQTIDFSALRSAGRDIPEHGEIEAAQPEAIDFASLRSSGPVISELGEIEGDEPEAIDFAALRSSDRHISEFGEIEPEAEADEEYEEEADEEPAGLGYASLRTRTPLDLSQPLPPAPEPYDEEVVPPAEPQVGHRLRGTINDLRRIAARG